MIAARFFIVYSINIRNIGGHSLKRSFNFKCDYATIRDIMLSIKGVFD
ncbi:hypothetical protein HMPREF1409_01453 [Helicobacter pylori GAM246Ai]|nr:hypothetical protein HMPREF1409_01453 [Helicobacter pylori GAM246Ai]